MLTIEVELLHGSFRGSGEDTALTGRDTVGEWPPSPARLLSALVAADGTRDRCHVTDGSELRVVEQLPAPLIYADAGRDVLVSPIAERFVVVNETKPGATQNYPARANSVARPGARRSPLRPHVGYVWPDADLDGTTLEGLQRRAARVGYLGCADTPVRVRVSVDAPSDRLPTTVWEPLGDRDAPALALPVPYVGMVDDLDALYDEFTRTGQVRRSWRPLRHQPYRDPGAMPAAAEVHQPGGTVVWLRFERAVPGRLVRVVTGTLRQAVFDLYQRKVLGFDEALPAVLTGHGFDGRGYEHVCWLALPDAGYEHSRGRLHGVAVWLPDSTPGDVVAGVRTALWHLRRLVQSEVFDIGVQLHSGERRPVAAAPWRWQQAATAFTSVFPVVHERHVRPEPTLGEVARWCAHAGLPEPTEVRLHRDPAVRGGASLRPHEVFRPEDPRRPYSHMSVWFDRPVAGPVVLGAKRHFGLGLFVPVEEPEAGEDA